MREQWSPIDTGLVIAIVTFAGCIIYCAFKFGV